MFEPPPSPRESGRRDPLSFDELLALVIAFLTVGAVLWWTLGRRAETWLGQQWAPPTAERSAEPNLIGSAETDAPQPPDRTVVSPIAQPSVPADAVARRNPDRTAAIGTALAPAILAPAIAPAIQPSPVAAPSPAESAIVVPSPTPETAIAFTDVPTSYWAYPFISELSKRGIVTGFADGTYQPDQPVNRAQYAALVSTLLPGNQQAPVAFGDVSGNFWAKPSIDKSVASGFVRGYPGGLYQPEQPISRMEVLLSLVNGFDLGKSSNPEPALVALQDQAEIPVWARPAIGTAAESGLIVGYPDPKVLNPNQPATRADVAAMLYQALNATGRVEPVQSNYIVRP
jgi:S-layer homology domain